MKEARTQEGVALLEPVRSDDPGMELLQLWEPCQRIKGVNSDTVYPEVANPVSVELSLTWPTSSKPKPKRTQAEDLLINCSRPRGGR